MKIATVLNAHAEPNTIIDTLESIFTYMTEDVIVVVDGAKWDDFKDVDIPATKMCGFRHGCKKAPYRNVALGLKSLTDTYLDADWYCYIEYDALVTSSRFKENLKMADEKGIWMLGNDGHVDDKDMPIIESLAGGNFKSIYYLIGCCQFFNKKFIDKLREINFFDRFLHLTNDFETGYFPKYEGYDISEHMYPTLCRHFGGNIGVFATYDYVKEEWHGSSEYFPIRWKPDLDSESEFPNASIMHPLKDFDHPFRKEHRERRKKWKKVQKLRTA